MGVASVAQPHTLFSELRRRYAGLCRAAFGRAEGEERSRPPSMSHPSSGQSPFSRDQRVPLLHPIPPDRISLGMTAMPLKGGIENQKQMAGVKRLHASVRKMRENHNAFSSYLPILLPQYTQIYPFFFLSFMAILTQATIISFLDCSNCPLASFPVSTHLPTILFSKNLFFNHELFGSVFNISKDMENWGVLFLSFCFLFSFCCFKTTCAGDTEVLVFLRVYWWPLK